VQQLLCLFSRKALLFYHRSFLGSPHVECGDLKQTGLSDIMLVNRMQVLTPLFQKYLSRTMKLLSAKEKAHFVFMIFISIRCYAHLLLKPKADSPILEVSLQRAEP